MNNKERLKRIEELKEQHTDICKETAELGSHLQKPGLDPTYFIFTDLEHRILQLLCYTREKRVSALIAEDVKILSEEEEKLGECLDGELTNSYFGDPEKPVSLSYNDASELKIDDLEGLIAKLQNEGVNITKSEAEFLTPDGEEFRKKVLEEVTNQGLTPLDVEDIKNLEFNIRDIFTKMNEYKIRDYLENEAQQGRYHNLDEVEKMESEVQEDESQEKVQQFMMGQDDISDEELFKDINTGTLFPGLIDEERAQHYQDLHEQASLEAKELAKAIKDKGVELKIEDRKYSCYNCKYSLPNDLGTGCTIKGCGDVNWIDDLICEHYKERGEE